jgi:hypothetical protein
MTTTNGNRKILDLKRWEFCTPAPVATNAGSLVISSRHYRQQQMLITSAAIHYLYTPLEDGWCQLPSGALAGTYGVGICGTATAVGPSGTATGGSTTALNTALTLARDLRGYSVHITGGPGAGDTRVIASNTTGANGIITPTVAFSAAITASSTYRLLTPRWYVLNAGTLAAGSFRYYDFALNTWTTLANTGLPATWSTDGKMIATPSWVDLDYRSHATGTATAGASTTLTNSAKAWASNQWANSQVRIVSGTGAGQIRTIASNTGTALTVSAAWATNPDATSVYSIEGNDDYLYLIGNNAVTLYRYSISSNTATTLAPGAARAGAPAVGMSGHWVWDCDDAAWLAESAIINGRRIYSFRGGAGAVLDYYDIAANTWVSGVVYAPLTEVFGAGSKYVYHDNFLYIHKDATGRWFRFNCVTAEMDGWNTMLYPGGSAVAGDTAFDAVFRDGATHIEYVYMVLNTSQVMLRQMVI